LKQNYYKKWNIFSQVAPRRGAWIETRCRFEAGSPDTVAPRRGAWIETLSTKIRFTVWMVAPRRGAWIETYENT